MKAGGGGLSRFFARGVAARAMAGGVLAAGVFAALAPAMAQNCANPNPETGGCFILTSSAAETITFNPAVVTVTSITNYVTQIIGRLAGGAALYDQTFNVAFADPLAQAGVAAARLAITAAGGPGVIIGAPVLTASSTATNSVSTTAYSLAGPPVDTLNPGVITFGPANLVAGHLSTCNVGGLPSTTRPSCQNLGGAPLTLGLNDTNINVHTDTVHTVNQATSTTNTTTVNEQYTLTGIVQALGRVHALAPSAIAEQGERFMRRLLGEASDDGEGAAPPPRVMSYAPVAGQNSPFGIMAFAPQAATTGAMPQSRFRSWLNGFGWHGHRSGSGGIPGDRRHALGIEGGFAFDVTGNLRLGFGMDHSQIRVALRGGGESVGINLTQAGLFAGWRNGPWYIAGAATAGFADASTRSAVAGIPGVTAGSYDAKTFGISGEAGYRFALDGWSLTPHIGADWHRVSLGAFVETGALALTSPGGDFERGKFWAGLKAHRSFGLGNGMSFSLSAFARAAAYSSGRDALSVAFAAAPGIPLTVTSPKLGRSGAEAGLSAALAITPNAELFAAYDMRWREKLVMHTGTAGLRVRW